jgi:hypothetical protein
VTGNTEKRLNPLIVEFLEAMLSYILANFFLTPRFQVSLSQSPEEVMDLVKD